ncbi:MAG: hypothetical protein GC184_15260 [Rhizobiales bacterium]|nr:hypothetical protein [Hyphomicrobiales bacterium]
MGGITLTSAVRSNLLSLQNTASLLETTQNRLATGLKVSSALDNPQSYFTAQGLNNRASDLSALLDDSSLGVQTLRAADEGIKGIQKLVDQAKSVANQALQAKATDTTLDATISATNLSGASAGARTFTIVAGGTTSSVVIDAADYTAAELASEIKSAIGSTVSGLTVSVSGATASLTLDTGEDLEIGGTLASAFGTTSSTNGKTETENRATYQTDFNDLRNQIDQLAGDASFNGVNLLNGDSLTVKFNEDGSSKLAITGKTFTAAGDLSISEAAFSDDDSVNSAITELNAATTTLRKQSSTFGANLSVVQNRQDFSKALINVLQTGAGNLTLADSNEESANLLALQTRQSISTQTLSLANQAEQNVLSLIR